MRALTVQPETENSARVENVSEPAPKEGAILVETLAVGVCGTDQDIIDGHYGTAPPGRDRLILGHESLGRVLEAPEGSGFAQGDLLAGIVRRPDPVPCPNCAAGEWDMCRNGRYTERGIKGLPGFCAERFRIEPEFAVKVPPALERVGVLVEPASVVAKAWEHVEWIGRRARWEPQRVLVTGAGPVGLLAALMATQRGLEVHVLDLVTEGPKPQLAQDLGATYHTSSVREACPEPDVVIECTGAPRVICDAMHYSAPGGVVCLTGLSSGGPRLTVDFADLNQSLVLENDVVFGSVNANRRHYEAAVESLARADTVWLERMITRRVPLDDWPSVFSGGSDDVKAVIEPNA